MTRKDNIKENDRKHYLDHKLHLGLCLRCQIIDLGKSMKYSTYNNKYGDQIRYYTSFLNAMHDKFKLVDTTAFNDVPTAKVPIPQIRPSEDYSTTDSMTQLLVSPIKKTNADMIKSSVWSSELNNYDFRLSIFNLLASEEDSCPICSVFRTREGFGHCSSFCSTEAKLRQSEEFVFIKIEEEEEEEPSTWIHQDLNRVRLSIRRVHKFRTNMQEWHFLDKMRELREEGHRLSKLMEALK